MPDSWPSGFSSEIDGLGAADLLDALDVAPSSPGVWSARGVDLPGRDGTLGGPLLAQVAVACERAVPGKVLRTLQGCFPSSGRLAEPVDLVLTTYGQGRSFAFVGITGAQHARTMLHLDAVLHEAPDDPLVPVVPDTPERSIGLWPWRVWGLDPVDGRADLVVQADIDADPAVHRALLHLVAEMVGFPTAMAGTSLAHARTRNVLHQSVTLHRPTIDLRAGLRVSTRGTFAGGDRWDAVGELRDGAGSLVASVLQGGVVRA